MSTRHVVSCSASHACNREIYMHTAQNKKIFKEIVGYSKFSLWNDFFSIKLLKRKLSILLPIQLRAIGLKPRRDGARWRVGRQPGSR